MIFTSKIDFEWTGIGELCANVFNVYKQTSPKLPDVFPAPGIADDYGSCLFNGLLVNHATDFVAPSTGDTSHYLVTAESPAGEGSLGPATVGPRPFSALTPQCPTPPPLP